MAELNRSLGGEELSAYSVSLDDHGKVTAHGFTGNVPAYAWCFPGGWWLKSGTAQPQTVKQSQMQAASGSTAR